MSMKWRELKDLINSIPEDRLDDNATLFDSLSGECIQLSDAGTIGEMDQQGDAQGVLDDDYFVIKAEGGTSDNNKINVNLSIFDEDGNRVDGTSMSISAEGISDIVDHASQIAILHREGKNVNGVLDELTEALIVYDVIGDQALNNPMRQG